MAYQDSGDNKKSKLRTWIIIVLCLIGSICCVTWVYGNIQRGNFIHATNGYADFPITAQHNRKIDNSYKQYLKQRKTDVKKLIPVKFHNPRIGNMRLATYERYKQDKKIAIRNEQSAQHNYDVQIHSHPKASLKPMRHYQHVIKRDGNVPFVKGTKLYKVRIHRINHKLNQHHLSKYDIRKN